MTQRNPDQEAWIEEDENPLDHVGEVVEVELALLGFPQDMDVFDVEDDSDE